MNMYRLLPFICWVSLGMAMFSSCTNPTEAGLGLLGEDLLKLNYVDTFTVETTSELSDSVRTHTPNSLLNAYLIGRMDDPIFGVSEAGLYTQLIPEYLNPSFTGAVVDSVVLVLPYDTSKFYGDTVKPFSLEVYQLLETINPLEAHFSNASYYYAPGAIGRTETTLSKDSVEVFDYAQSTQDTISFPHLRVPIDRSLGQELLNLDSIYYSTDSVFQTFFRGIFIKPGAQNNAMMGADLSSDRGGMIVYFRVDTVSRQFNFQFSPYVANVPVFKHKVENRPVASQ
ncbi:MAG: DUF4270 family protein, partial [Haliscomenobacter sp.]